MTEKELIEVTEIVQVNDRLDKWVNELFLGASPARLKKIKQFHAKLENFIDEFKA